MSLVTLDLPRPDELRNRWAAYAAVLTALGFGDGCHAARGRWHFDDGGGNWADLTLLPDGRAVLYGRDHEYSDTYYGPHAQAAGQPATDILAGAPDWWLASIPPVEAGDYGPGFIYGFDGERWQRAAYDTPDGFGSVGLPALSDDAVFDAITEHIDGEAFEAGGDGHQPDRSDLRALTKAGPAMSSDQLDAVLGPVRGDINAGVSAARKFAS